MAATIFWRKDEPDESQIKEVYEPGIHLNSVKKLNSNIIHVESKPWLQNDAFKKQTKKETRPLQKSQPKIKKQDRVATGTVQENFQEKIMAASLKDLCNEDKKRITNLIKELAKAAEERKVAIGALHDERNNFKDKESQLRSEQEKLIMERDQLRETLLEYQFLINQYSKQLQDEKVAKDVSPLPTSKGNDPLPTPNKSLLASSTLENLENVNNLRPNARTVEVSEKPQCISTYYPVNNIDQNSCIQHISNEETVMKIYSGMDAQFNDLASKNENIHSSSLFKANENENKPVADDKNIIEDQDGKKSDEIDVNNSIMTQNKLLKMQSDVQNGLLQQQNVLLKQQMEIQQQIEQLQAIQKHSTDELLKALKPANERVLIDRKEMPISNENVSMQTPVSGDVESEVISSKRLRLPNASKESHKNSFPRENLPLFTDHSMDSLQKTSHPAQKIMYETASNRTYVDDSMFISRQSVTSNKKYDEKQPEKGQISFANMSDNLPDKLDHGNVGYSSTNTFLNGGQEGKSLQATYPFTCRSNQYTHESGPIFDDINYSRAEIPVKSSFRVQNRDVEPNIRSPNGRVQRRNTAQLNNQMTDSLYSGTVKQLSLLDPFEDTYDRKSFSSLQFDDSDYGSYLQFQRKSSNFKKGFCPSEMEGRDKDDMPYSFDNSYGGDELESEVFADIFYLKNI